MKNQLINARILEIDFFIINIEIAMINKKIQYIFGSFQLIIKWQYVINLKTSNGFEFVKDNFETYKVQQS